MFTLDLGLKAKIRGYMLVTAGGTIVDVDDVRIQGNRSKGGTGVAIANSAAERGVKVILLCTEYTKLKYWIHPNVIVVIYETYNDYAARLKEIAEKYTVAYAVSAAAVSDFGFEAVEGKIDSKSGALPQHFELPKVLATWREMFGKACYLTGFKLHATPKFKDGKGERREPTKREWKAALDRLLAAADNQLKECHLNLTCANFAPWKGNADTMRGKKRLWLRRPDGGGIELYGTDRQVAAALVDYILEQADVTWGRSSYKGSTDVVREEMSPTFTMCDEPSHTFALAGEVLKLAQDTGLLHSRAGNVTVCAGLQDDNVQAWVTPRGKPKDLVTQDDLCFVAMAAGQDTKIEYLSQDPDVKGSIDARVYMMVRRMFPYEAAIHFHDSWVIDPHGSTVTDYACGTNKAAGEILAALTRADAGAHDLPVMIELTRHGHTLFLRDEFDVEDLRAQWEITREDYLAHLEEVGTLHRLDEMQLMPIFYRDTIVGLTARHKAEGWHSFFLSAKVRSRGIGAKLVEMINERGVNVGVHRDCEVLQFYLDRGFQVVEERPKEGLTILMPPRLRDDVRRAATIRVVCPATRRVLLGKRSPDYSYPNLWCNLGGMIEKDPETDEDKDAWEEAVREFKDESGVDLSHLPRPTSWSIHYTTTMKGDQRIVKEVTCFEVDVPWECPAAPQTDELVTISWHGFDELPHLARGHATKETHRDLAERYPAE